MVDIEEAQEVADGLGEVVDRRFRFALVDEAGRVRYIVLRNKSDRLGQWISEKRNIYEDYRRLFKDINGGEPPEVVGVTIFINAHNTKSQAESRFCDAYFSRN